MREYLFHGKCKRTGEWVQGLLGWIYYLNLDDEPDMKLAIQTTSNSYEVFEESIGQYTGMNEFVVTDRKYNKPLFEGDIVEVWSTRRPCHSNPKSQYDGDVKVRAVIRFTHGEWTLDYENNYNKSLTKLKGKEADERTVDGDWVLYRFGCHGREEWQREHNIRYKWHDIVKIGNVFENKDLLESEMK